MKKTIYEKLEDKTFYSPDGCWYWTGSVTCSGNGYGQIQYNGVNGAHRVAYTISKGPIPEGMFVCHTCDNRRCINPDHLWLGNAKQNAVDTSNKLRIRNKWTGKSSDKLTEEQVMEILLAKESVIKLAKRYSVSRPTIYRIKWKETWRHVTTRK